MRPDDHSQAREGYCKMKHAFRFCSVVAALALMAGCSSSVNLPPVEPEDVEVFLPGSQPQESYEVMTRFTVRVGLQDSDQMLIDGARARAAEMGADAVIVMSMRRTSEGGVDLDLSQEQEKILEALAVYFPSRHPELENQ